MIDDVGAVAAREREPLRHEVDDDELARRLELRHLHHHQADRTGAGDHDDVVELDVAARDGVDGARQRLDDRGILERHLRRNPVHARGRRDAHELRHAAVGHLALEAEDVVHFAHPVLAGAAVAALVAGHDLLGDDAIAERDAEMLGRAVAQRLDVAEELVARESPAP